MRFVETIRMDSVQSHPKISDFVPQGAGHHVYADKPDEFNKLVNAVAEYVDQTQTGECLDE